MQALAEPKDPKARGSRDPSGSVARILAAAREEFGANGFDGTRVEHIARRAKVSKQLVYLYFDGKSELYSELLKTISIESYTKLLKIDFDALDPQTAVRTYILSIYDQYRDDPVMAMVTLDQSLHNGAQIRLSPEAKRMHDAVSDRLGKVVERGKSAGLLNADVTMESLEFMTVIIVAGCVSSRGMFSRFLGRSLMDQDDPAFWRNYALSFILRALRGDEKPSDQADSG